MSNQRRMRRRMRQSRDAHQKDSERLYAVTVEQDGRSITRTMTRAQLTETLEEAQKKGWKVKSDTEGMWLVPPDPPVLSSPSLAPVAEATPTPQPEPTMQKRKIGHHPFEAHLKSPDERREYVELCHKLLARGFAWYQISIEVCQYEKNDSAMRACQSIEAGRTSGNLRALKLLRAKVAELEAADEPEKADGDSGIAITAPKLAVVPAAAQTAPPWWSEYLAVVEAADEEAARFANARSKMEDRVLDLIAAVEQVPEDFRGKAMMDKLQSMTDLVQLRR